ncbi:hypothetical protein V5S96_09995 [Corynebacterium mastitidis]|uniref:Uncharacterized protein n=1 Tax=Corynebacterium mastitidis TaxID=161890 RepID=A0ABU8P080_9CORY
MEPRPPGVGGDPGVRGVGAATAGGGPGVPAAEDSDDEEDAGDGSEAELKDTLGTMFPGIVVRREGVVVARLKSMNEKKISLVTGNAPKDGECTTILLAPSRPGCG